MKIRKLVSIFLAVTLVLTSCNSNKHGNSVQSESAYTTEILSELIESSESEDAADTAVSATTEQIPDISDLNLSYEEQNVNFNSLDDPELLRYMQDDIYANLVTELASDDYFVENVEALYISKEYLDEVAYNSQANIFFGYTIAELDEQFGDTKYVFTLGENGDTIVTAFEDYDDTYEKVIRNVAVGTGVILVCVTVSVITGGAGAAAVSMIYAASAKTGTICALSSGLIGGISAGVVKSFETDDTDEILKAAALAGSEGFKWGAITGAVAGGATEAIALKGATLNGLSMNEAAVIQKESKYPIDVIKQFKNMEQYNICKEAGLVPKMINGKTALVRNINLKLKDEFGRTNIERMKQGLAAIDEFGNSFELHHIGQKMDSTLAILSKAEHMQGGNNAIWHEFGNASEIDRALFDIQRSDFWKSMASVLGGI